MHVLNDCIIDNNLLKKRASLKKLASIASPFAFVNQNINLKHCIVLKSNYWTYMDISKYHLN